MSDSKLDIKHHATHISVDLLAGLLIGVFYKPKTATGYAVKGAIAGLVVYHLLHDPKADSSQTPH